MKHKGVFPFKAQITRKRTQTAVELVATLNMLLVNLGEALVELNSLFCILGNLILLKDLRTIRNLKRWKRFQKAFIRNRPVETIQRKTKKYHNEEILKMSVYHRTGILESTFIEIYKKIKPQILKRKRQSLPAPLCLLITLHYLRHYPRIQLMSDQYEVNPTTLWRTIKRTCLILSTMNVIEWPLAISSPFGQIVGAIDCTSHPRSRVFPEQYWWYRGDKGFHFVTSQIIVSLDGQILHVSLAKGHNNDQGMYNMTKMSDFLSLNNYLLVGDGGYSSPNLVTPDEDAGKAWNYYQKLLRLVVEYVIFFAKCFDFLRVKVRVAPEMQQIGILATYQVVALDLRNVPLTPPSYEYLSQFQVKWQELKELEEVNEKKAV